MPLSDTHLVLLSAASQREDGLLPLPNKLAGAALLRVESALLKAIVAEPVQVRADQPHWRRDENGDLVGLRITPTGLTTIRVEPHGGDAPSPEDASPATAAGQTSTPAPQDRPAGRLFRAGSKLARLQAMLTQAEGATIDALVQALSWQPHTVRAALTRMRQNGAVITTSKNRQNSTAYQIATGPDQTGSLASGAGEAA